MAEAQKCRAVEIFKLGGMYASDSNTIDHATVSLTGPIQDKETQFLVRPSWPEFPGFPPAAS